MLRAEEETHTLSKRCSPVLSNRDAVFDKRQAAQVLLLLLLTIISRYLGAFFACFFSDPVYYCVASLLLRQFQLLCTYTYTHIHSNSMPQLLGYFYTFYLFAFLFMQQLLSASPLRHVQMHSNTQTHTHTRSSSFYSSSSSLPDNSTFFCSSPHQFHISANPKPN